MVRASGPMVKPGTIARDRQPAGNDLGLVALSLLQLGSVAVAMQAAASIPIDRLNASNDE